MERWSQTAVGMFLAVAVVSATPGTVAAARDGESVEPVRLYTNADLERFGPPDTSPGPVTADDDPGWEFVNDFLAREHARLEADRSYDLERRRAAAEAEEVPRCRARSTHHYPYSYYGRPYHRSGRHPRDRRARVEATSSLGGRIVPLHARPSLAEVQRAKAIRRSGTDAFPSRARRAD